MAGYVVLALFAVALVWFAVRLRRTPPMPARRPFEEDPGASVIGSARTPPDPTAYSSQPRAGDGGF